MTVGQSIQAIRKEKGLTQKQLAEKCGLATGTIQQYELNKREPRQEQLKKIATALNVSIREILSYDNMVGDITPSGDIVYVDSDLLEYNRIIDKQKNGDGFTPYDKHFISNFIDKSPIIREWFIANGLKSKEQNMQRIQAAYEHLNEDGQKEAAKRIEELTEIERYATPKPWFRGKYSKDEIEKAVEAYLNNATADEPPEE